MLDSAPRKPRTAPKPRTEPSSASAPDITLEPTCEVGAITGRRARRGWRCSSMTAARPVRRVALLLLLLIGAQAQALRPTIVARS